MYYLLHSRYSYSALEYIDRNDEKILHINYTNPVLTTNFSRPIYFM